MTIADSRPNSTTITIASLATTSLTPPALTSLLPDVSAPTEPNALATSPNTATFATAVTNPHSTASYTAHTKPTTATPPTTPTITNLTTASIPDTDSPAIAPGHTSTASGRDDAKGHSGWQGFSSQHRIKHGVKHTEKESEEEEEEEEEEGRKWYEPAYAEYRMAYDPPWHYAALFLVFASPVAAIVVITQTEYLPQIRFWVARACMIADAQDQSESSLRRKADLI